MRAKPLPHDKKCDVPYIQTRPRGRAEEAGAVTLARTTSELLASFQRTEKATASEMCGVCDAREKKKKK